MSSSGGKFPNAKKSTRVNERDASGNNAIVRIIPDEPKYVLRAAEFTLLHRYKKHRPGVGIFVDRVLVQHLTRDEALELSNQLVDAVEADRVDPRAAKEPGACPRCSKPATGPTCGNCNADTSKTYLKVRIK